MKWGRDNSPAPEPLFRWNQCIHWKAIAADDLPAVDWVKPPCMAVAIMQREIAAILEFRRHRDLIVDDDNIIGVGIRQKRQRERVGINDKLT